MASRKITIGRNPSNNIATDPSVMTVSSFHADIERVGSHFVFFDHSSNGTYINGRRVHNTSVQLMEGDKVLLAGTLPLDWNAVMALLPENREVPQAPSEGTHPSDKLLEEARALEAAHNSLKPAPESDSNSPDSGNGAQQQSQGNAPSKSTEALPTNGNQSSPDDSQDTARSANASGEKLPERRPGEVFDGRYRLLKCLGSGASAQVWQAEDLKANGLVVALKIFAANNDLSRYGFVNFEKEFIIVFNLKHSKLLTPTGYEICQGCPYLVMQYCKNGSSSSMVGRATNDEIIRFLHDVSAGLEVLHANDLVHKDIKPDNIMLDKDRNFMITDFGISDTNSDRAQELSAGTQAYMSPERFNGISQPPSDIWAAGATAYELVTGTVPFGSQGGSFQAQGAKVPMLPDSIDPEVRNIVAQMLNADPDKRPTAAEIRRKTELYLETGSWTRSSGRKPVIILLSILGLLLLGAGIWYWDYSRLKTSYYADYVEVYGVPQGIGKLSGSQASNRVNSWRIQRQKGKVVRLSFVDNKGNVDSPGQISSMLGRFPDTRYYYKGNDSLESKKVYDNYGYPLFTMSFNNIRVATLLNEESFSFNVAAGDRNTFDPESNALRDRSNVSKYRYEYDKHGRTKRVLYTDNNGTAAHTTENSYGIKYEYDPAGHIVRFTNLSANKKPTPLTSGIITMAFEYDENGNITEMQYLNADGKPMEHPLTGVCTEKYTVDAYGNPIEEWYYDCHGRKTNNYEEGYAGTKSEIIDGQRVKVTYHGLDGKLINGKEGYAILKIGYDNHGFINSLAYFDTDEQPFENIYEMPYHRMDIVNDDKGRTIRFTNYDAEGKPATGRPGVSSIIFEYDDKTGLLKSKSYCDANGKPVNNAQMHYHKEVYNYNDQNSLKSVEYFDASGKPAMCGYGYHKVVYGYNPNGSISRERFFDTKGKPVCCTNNFHMMEISYDQDGNWTSIVYYGTDGKRCANASSAKSRERRIDHETNKVMKDFYPQLGKSEYPNRYTSYEYDNATGRIVSETNYTDGKIDGYVERYSYSDGSRLPSSVKYYNQQGNKASVGPCHEKRMAYKTKGLGYEMREAYYDTNGSRTTNELGAYETASTYDASGRLLSTISYGRNKSRLPSVPEKRCTYDAAGNLLTEAYYGSDNKPARNGNGIHKIINTYAPTGEQLSTTYCDTNGKPFRNSDRISKLEQSYNPSGTIKEWTVYGPSYCAGTNKFKYNDQGQTISSVFYNTQGSVTNNPFFGYSRQVTEYDTNGFIPTRRITYYDGGRRITEVWDKRRGEWRASRQ